MHHQSRSVVLGAVFGLCLCLAPFAVAAPPAAPTARSPSAKLGAAKLDTYIKADGEGFFALSLSPEVAQPPSPAQLLTVVFDTSASQTGAYREKALQALDALLAEQSPADRVALLAADVDVVPLTEGFVPATSEAMRKALNQLRQRVPLGATDMGAAIDAAARLQSATEAPGVVRRVAYLGDGVSSMRTVSTQRMQLLANRCVELRMPVNCYAIGPQVDLPLLGAIAKNTGGTIVIDDDEADGRRAGGELADAVRGMVVWPKAIELPAGLHAVYFRGVPPLRFDRETVLVGHFDSSRLKGEGPQPIRLSGELSGKPVELEFEATISAPSDDHSYLAELVKAADSDGGASLPTLGSAALSDLRKLVNARAQNLSHASQQALAVGNLAQADWLAGEAAEMDPQNPEAAIVRTAVHKARLRAGQEPAQPAKLTARRAQGDAPDGSIADGVGKSDEPADGELLDEVERQQRVYQQFLQSEVRNVINESRRTMAIDPEAASSMLKLTLEKVRQAPEIAPELRDQLVDQIEAALQAASRQALVKSQRDLTREQIAAEADARRRITQELYLQEQKIDQLMSRFNALMDEERYRDAEAVANIAEEMSPGTAGLRDAELAARMIGYVSDMMAVVDARHKGLVDSLYQVELSHVPTPDEPPILYPDPEVWQLLTERRKKYKAVDLTQSNPNEAKIVAALDDKTELEFVDQPLTDVVDYLKERHAIEIQLDSKALTDEGIGTDTPITRNIRGITLRSALRLMLGELDLTYIIRNEVLMITTKTEAENMLSTKVYPVADLVVPVRSGGMGGMGGRGMF